MSRLTYLQAVSAAMREEMERDERVFVMGEDVAFNMLGTTPGFVERFGTDRVRNTPISEAGFVGAAAGAAMVGMRPIVDMMIAPFMYCAFDQIVSIIAKSTYLYGGQSKMPVTLRAGMFYGNGTAAQHSDRPMATFMTIPGLKIIAPASPSDAKGLLKTAIRDDDPVLCFEDNRLWTLAEEVPEGEHLVPLGQASITRAGRDVTIVGIAGSVVMALGAAEVLAGDGIDAEVIDVRSLIPLDMATILASVEKTGRLVIADPSHEICSPASHIAAVVAEEGFFYLHAPIRRITTPHVHIPFSPPLEKPLYPNVERIVAAVSSLVEARA
jgi:acetoin:2,6-dichlorophenolindophenol oxidoreductase subunit beta